MKRLLLFPLLLLLLLTACERTPGPVMNREPLARLLVDLELAEAYSIRHNIGGSGVDSVRRVLRQSILAKHGVNEATLDTTLRWYGYHLPRFMRVMDRADSILADTLRRLDRAENIALRTAAGDSVDVWPIAPSALFSRSEPSSFLVFEIPVDSTWARGDVLTLKFNIDNAMSPMSTTLAVDYADRIKTTDVVTVRQYIDDQRSFEVKLQLDSNMNSKLIYGYMHLEAKPGERAYVDSIRLIRTRLVSKDYNTIRRQTSRFSRNDK